MVEIDGPGIGQAGCASGGSFAVAGAGAPDDVRRRGGGLGRRGRAPCRPRPRRGARRRAAAAWRNGGRGGGGSPAAGRRQRARYPCAGTAGGVRRVRRRQLPEPDRATAIQLPGGDPGQQQGRPGADRAMGANPSRLQRDPHHFPRPRERSAAGHRRVDHRQCRQPPGRARHHRPGAAAWRRHPAVWLRCGRRQRRRGAGQRHRARKRPGDGGLHRSHRRRQPGRRLDAGIQHRPAARGGAGSARLQRPADPPHLRHHHLRHLGRFRHGCA
ncbi:hypothetical protein A203_19690 [Chromobacterium violaceum]